LYDFDPWRGRDLIALLIAISISAGTVLGWFAYKASLRIQAWGLNMNAQDRIFQEAVREDSVDSQRDRKRPEADHGPVPALGRRQMPFGAVSSK
jgi:hypothetical protein